MGAVFSVCDSSRFIENIILRFGDAAFEAFKMYSSNYNISVQIAFQFCEPAETEPFEDFAAVVRELCAEGINSKYEAVGQILQDKIKIKRRWHRAQRHSFTSAHPSRESPAESQSRVKQLFLATVRDALIYKAQRFRRRFDLYGPPDWIDPAETTLPPRNFCGLRPPNVISSLFPHAVPHIIIHFAPNNEESLYVAWMNRLDCQDHEWGNKLVVTLPSSPSGPHPSVARAAARYPFAHNNLDDSEVMAAPPGQIPMGREDSLFAAVPNLISDEDSSAIFDDSYDSDMTCSMNSAATTESELKEAESSYTSEEFMSDKRSEFWIPEDEEELPTLPEDWLKPKASPIYLL